LLLRTPANGPGGESARPVLCELVAGKPHHVIVSYAAGRTACYVNGAEVSASRAVTGGLGNWTPQHLVFGDEYAGGADWAGRLEGIAVYSRFVDAAEAKRKYALYSRRLANRRPARRLVVIGRLVEAAATPTVKAIRPYRRCLTVHTYEVREVLSGTYDRREILVAHWAILDAKVVGFRRRVGRAYRLTVEPFADHPQLATERVVTTLDQLDPEMYYDVERISAGVSPSEPTAPARRDSRP
ncbi:MAG: LamG-like jellyroll fold domain-containing protein, partial [Phycisphaerae bacterium]